MPRNTTNALSSRHINAAEREHTSALLYVGELLANMIDGRARVAEIDRAELAQQLLSLGLEDVEDAEGESLGAHILDRIDPDGASR